MNRLKVENYNFEITFLGGQAFNFDSCEGVYLGFTQDKIIKLKNEKEYIYWQTYPEKDDLEYIKKYLGLKTNYSKILRIIDKDKYIRQAIKKHPNIRILNQDFEQTLLSFLISSNNNIRSIRKIIRQMCRKLGKSINTGEEKIYLFPRTEVLANARLEDLLECKLGFRAKFLKAAAKYLLESGLDKKIKSMKEETARSSLMQIKGVGEKIADCVLVFSLGYENVTPLDVWGKRICTNFYKLNSKMKYQEMRQWLGNYFEGYAGLAGQFLYEYIRSND